MTDQANRVLVTGAGQSVGRAIAEAFHASGARVHFCDRDAGLVAAVLEASPGLSGSVTDVSDPASVDVLFADADRSLGGVDVLVNVVGIGGPRGRIDEISIDEWRQTMVTNVDSMFFCIRKALPGMRSRKRGVIVNFSSASTKTAMPMRSPYVASKAAVEGLTRTLARELGPDGITVNAILPGMIDNARLDFILSRIARDEGRTTAEIEQEMLGFVSTRSKIQPDEIAATVVFLASDAARNISGQMLGVCGNMEWEM